jgi:hypothetical protein
MTHLLVLGNIEVELSVTIGEFLDIDDLLNWCFLCRHSAELFKNPSGCLYAVLRNLHVERTVWRRLSVGMQVAAKDINDRWFRATVTCVDTKTGDTHVAWHHWDIKWDETFPYDVLKSKVKSLKHCVLYNLQPPALVTPPKNSNDEVQQQKKPNHPHRSLINPSCQQAISILMTADCPAREKGVKCANDCTCLEPPMSPKVKQI